MVRLRGVAGGGADALVEFFDELVVIELTRTLDAPGDAGTVVKEFGKGFREAVGDGFDHDGLVVVVIGLVFVGEFVRAVDSDDEATEVVFGVLVGTDVIGES